MAKRSMTVDAALKWAFREELPKRERAQEGGLGFASVGAAWDSFAELLTKVDFNCYGVVPDFTGAEPHPDAVRLGDAVMALNVTELMAPEGWNPIADWGDLGALGKAACARALDQESTCDATGMRLYKRAPSHLVVHYAVFGDHGEWRGDKPEALPVLENGKAKWFRMERKWVDAGRRRDQNLGHWVEFEASGVDKKRRPLPGAYRKFVLEPDPMLTIKARMDWEVWRDCLDVVFETVGELSEIALLPSALPLRPWESGVEAPRVLRVEGSRGYDAKPPVRAKARDRRRREKIIAGAVDMGQSLDIACAG